MSSAAGDGRGAEAAARLGPLGWDLASVDLERALALLALPRQIGLHPEDGVPVEAGIGRYGPYVKHAAKYVNLPDVEEVFTIGMNCAVEVLASKADAGRRRRSRRWRNWASILMAARAGDERALRSLCQMGQGQRHAARAMSSPLGP